MTSNHKVKLVITDLDNTLYDWVSSFVPAFYDMVDEACKILGVSQDSMLDDLQKVHRKHGSSEHPFALLEANVVIESTSGLSDVERTALLDPAFHKFNRVRKEKLKLYDGVKETLRAIRSCGTVVVAHTDAKLQNSLFRIEKLGLLNSLDGLYAPQHVLPRDNFSKRSDDYPSNFVSILPATDVKPNPSVVLDICSRYSISPPETLYIGDSVTRDIYMAKSAGAIAAWARYGTIYDRQLWEKLVRITHWTKEDVEKDVEIRQMAQGIHADVDLNHFSEIIEKFDFCHTYWKARTS